MMNITTCDELCCSVCLLRWRIFQLFRSQILLLITQGVCDHFCGGFVVNSKTVSKPVPRKCYPLRVNTLLVTLALNPKKFQLHWSEWTKSDIFARLDCFHSAALFLDRGNCTHQVSVPDVVWALSACSVVIWASDWSGCPHGEDIASWCGSVSIPPFRYRVFCWVPWWAADAQAEFPGGVAVGKLGIATSDGRTPRLVVDQSVCGLNHNDVRSLNGPLCPQPKISSVHIRSEAHPLTC